jgi:hypothetical protein
MKTVLSILLLLPSLSSAGAPQGAYETNAFVETIAGSGFEGHIDGVGTETMFSFPTAIVVDSQTNVFVWDMDRVIRKVSHKREVSTLASNLPIATVDNLTTDGDTILAIGHMREAGGGTPTAIVRIDPNGQVDSPRIVAPTPTTARHRCGITRNANGIFFTYLHRIYILTNGIVAIFAGSGEAATADGQGIFSSFYVPSFLATDSANNIYVGTSQGIRMVSPQAMVSTILQNQNGINDTTAFAVSLPGVICWTTTSTARRWIGGDIRIIGGTDGQTGFRDGEAGVSLLTVPLGAAFGPDNRLYFSSSFDHRIRRITFASIPLMQIGVELTPAITVRGTIGDRFRIEGRDDLSKPWETLETLTLSVSPTVWVDRGFPSRAQRVYRAVQLP